MSNEQSSAKGTILICLTSQCIKFLFSYAEAMTVEYNQIVYDQPEKLSIGNGNTPMDMEIDDPQCSVTAAGEVTKNDLVLSNEIIKQQMPISNAEPFDEDAFKKSFLLPKFTVGNKKKKLPKEKQSTVITSEAWKENEKKKLEEKGRKEAEKGVRKLDREQKKILASQAKAEKELAKEKKKNEKAEKETEKKKRVSKKMSIRDVKPGF